MANRPEEPDNVTLDGNALGCLLLCALIAGMFIYFPYTFWYAPSHRADLSARDFAGDLAAVRRMAAVRLQVGASIVASDPRLEILQAGNLDIYLTAQDIEEVPYPDRREFVQRVGNAWCSGLDLSYLPAVRFRNVKTGEVLARYSCSLKKVTLY